MRRAPLAPVLGWILAAERKRQGLSQESIAQVLGCGQSWLSRCETGATDATFRDVLRWAQRLGLDLGQLSAKIAHASAALGERGVVLDHNLVAGQGDVSGEIIRSILVSASLTREG